MVSPTSKVLLNVAYGWREWQCLVYVLQNYFSLAVSVSGPVASTDLYESIICPRESLLTVIQFIAQEMHKDNMTLVVMVKLCTKVPNLYRCATYTKLIEYTYPKRSAKFHRCYAEG